MNYHTNQKISRRVLYLSLPTPYHLVSGTIAGAKIINAMLDDGWQVDIIGIKQKDCSFARDETLYSLISKSEIFEADCWWRKNSLWTFPAYHIACKLIKEINYDFIFSASPHTWTQVVGWLLKKKTGLPWLTFFTDPWGNNPDLCFPAIRKAMERRVLLSCDAICYSNRKLQEWALSQFPDIKSILERKAFVIPYLFDSQLYPEMEKSGDNKKIVIRHMGQIPIGGYIISFLKGLSILFQENPALRQKLIFEFVGRAEPRHKGKVALLLKKLNLSEQVVFDYDDSKVIHMPYAQSLGLIKSADALLLLGVHPDFFGGWGDTILHVKLVDYLGADRPIFAMASENSVTNELLDDGVSVCTSDDPVLIKNALLKFISKMPKSASQLRERFSRGSVYPLWQNVFEKLIDIKTENGH